MQGYDLLGVLVATFPIRACAEEAVRDLRHAGVRHSWLGVTKIGEETRVAGGAHEHVAATGIGHAIARWFHREHDEPLFDALREHGIAESVARRIDGAVAEGHCLLVAEDVIEPAKAAAIARGHGGTILVTADDTEDSAPMNDPMSEPRIEAARRHPARM
jgi:hypothetical protein